MTIYDGVMIGLILAGMIFGAIRGITWQLAGIASLACAYFFSHQVSGYLAPYIPGEPAIKRAGSMLAAYVLMSAGIFFIAWSVRATLKKMKFEAYDRHLGMVLGGLEGALLGLVGTLFVVGLSPGSRDPIFSSTSGRAVARVMDSAGPVLPIEVRKVVEPYWSHVKNPTDAAQVAASEVQSPPDSPDVESPLDRVKARVGRAAASAVKDEIDRFGDSEGPRDRKRR